MVPYLGSVNEHNGVHNFNCYNLDSDAAFTAGLIKDGETKETKVDLLPFFDDSNCNLYFEADFYRTVRTGTYTVNLYQNGELFGFANGVMIKCTSDPYVKLAGNAASGMCDTNSVCGSTD